jgi:hypothetical protein
MLMALVTLVSMAWADQPGQVLLDCNTPVGPDQQVTVLKTANGLKLKELTTSGSVIERDLGIEEWQKGSLMLHERDASAKTTLWNTPHGWWVESISPGFRETSAADCGL